MQSDENIRRTNGTGKLIQDEYGVIAEEKERSFITAGVLPARPTSVIAPSLRLETKSVVTGPSNG